jgi:hypothetical protein
MFAPPDISTLLAIHPKTAQICPSNETRFGQAHPRTARSWNLSRIRGKETVERVATRQGTKTYQLQLNKLGVGDTDYIDLTKVNRKQNPPSSFTPAAAADENRARRS